MPAAQDLAKIGRHVAATHGWAAAKAFKAYVWNDEDRARIAACVTEILKIFPKGAGQDELLVATVAFQLERRLAAPVYLVAGTLWVDGVAVRSDRMPADGASPFGQGERPWRGHLWIMIGPYVVDTALFRLANASDCPPVLARHVHSVFGGDKGVYVDHWRNARRVGLGYDPVHVLSQEEVAPLMSAAYALMKDATQ